MTAPDVSVVIPAYNEAEILATTVNDVVTGLRARSVSFEIVIVENGSTDGTRALAEELAATHDEVRAEHIDVGDYGLALKTGLLAATGTAVVNFDADYYDLDFLNLALREDADIVVAAKSLRDSEDTRAFLRRLASRTFGWLVHTLLELEVSETHGMKLFHRQATQHLAMEVHSTKDLFDTELLARAEWSGLRIRELPIRTVEMRHSRSGILRRVPRTIWGLLIIRIARRSTWRTLEESASLTAQPVALEG
ncbi:MAG: glycosyltransferase family 2 protein [Actinomycetota bacterium]